MSEYEIRDLVRYLHNVKKKDGSANPIIGEDELGVVAILSYLLEDSNFVSKRIAELARPLSWMQSSDYFQRNTSIR